MNGVGDELEPVGALACIGLWSARARVPRTGCHGAWGRWVTRPEAVCAPQLLWVAGAKRTERVRWGDGGCEGWWGRAQEVSLEDRRRR